MQKYKEKREEEKGVFAKSALFGHSQPWATPVQVLAAVVGNHWLT